MPLSLLLSTLLLATPSGLTPFGTTWWGGAGANDVLSGSSAPAGTWTLNGGAEFLTARSLLGHGDSDSLQSQRLALMWAPVEGVEVGLSQSAVDLDHFLQAHRELQWLGTPTLHGKYVYGGFDRIGIGAYADLRFPTSEFGTGLAPRGLSVNAAALAGGPITPWLEWAVNLGYRYDRTRYTFDTTPDIVQRFVFAAGPLHSFTYGASLLTRIPLDGPNLVLTPLLEWLGGIGGGVRLRDDPSVLTIAAKLYSDVGRLLELTLGANVRLAGPPQADAVTAGVAPWRAFIRLGVHLGGPKPPPCVVEPAACPAPPPPPPPCPTPPGNFTVRGVVVDSITGRVIPGSSVQIGGFETRLSTAGEDGAFVSWPIEAGDGLLKLVARAPGYHDQEFLTRRGKANSETTVRILLINSLVQAGGVLRGIVTDGKSGSAVYGVSIDIPGVDRRVEASPAGDFQMGLPSGPHRVEFSAQGYRSQTKDVVILEGDVVIMNVELTPERAE